MPKPNYDDLIFLIAFLWKWSDESDVLTALTHEEEYEGEAYESFSRLIRETLKEDDFYRARKILWSVKDEITKINGFLSRDYPGLPLFRWDSKQRA